jgi:cell division protease FtsH
VSTGARDDLLKATDIARSMVKAYGMSATLGQLSLEREHRPVYLGGGGPQAGDYSPETAREIDSEVRRLLGEQHARATALLGARTETLRRAATILLEKETLTGDELEAIAAGQGGPVPAGAARGRTERERYVDLPPPAVAADAGGGAGR